MKKKSLRIIDRDNDIKFQPPDSRTTSLPLIFDGTIVNIVNNEPHTLQAQRSIQRWEIYKIVRQRSQNKTHLRPFEEG